MIIRKILKKLDIFYVFIVLFIIVLFHTLILEYFAIKNEEESLPSSNKGKNNNSLRKTSSQRNVMKKNFKINEPVPTSVEERIAMALNTPFFKKSNEVKISIPHTVGQKILKSPGQKSREILINQFHEKIFFEYIP